MRFNTLQLKDIIWIAEVSILVDQLTLSQPGGADYAHHFISGTPDFLAVRGLQKYARNFKFHDAFFSYQQDVLHCFGPKKAIIGIKFLV
mgnify:CR=1 FL=1